MYWGSYTVTAADNMYQFEFIVKNIQVVQREEAGYTINKKKVELDEEDVSEFTSTLNSDSIMDIHDFDKLYH